MKVIISILMLLVLFVACFGLNFVSMLGAR